MSLLLPPISLQSFEDLRLQTFILSFLLLLNKNNNLLKQQEDAGRGSEKPLLQGFWNGALPSHHEKLPPQPRVDFPQTTRNYPPNHESISLKPREITPQTTSRLPSNHENRLEMGRNAICRGLR